MLADDVVARLGAVVPALTDRVQGALQLTELIRQKALPNYTPAAFVVPNGLVFGEAQYETGYFIQGVDEVISIVLILRSAGDVRGAKVQGELQALIWAVIAALAGWSPESLETDEPVGPVGVLVPKRGSLARLDAGTVFYQLDFSIQQQLRVT